MKKGFTLLELLIVVVIIGIIAAIAIPSYTSHVRNARRTDGQAALLDAYARMERFYAENNSYQTATISTGSNTDILNDPDSTCSGASAPSSEGFYCISFQAGPTATTYTLQAAPLATGPQAGDVCGTLSINSLGQKSAASSATIDCW